VIFQQSDLSGTVRVTQIQQNIKEQKHEEKTVSNNHRQSRTLESAKSSTEPGLPKWWASRKNYCL